jgi:HK97 family phage portal protein
MAVKALPVAWPAWREGRPAWKLIDYQAYVADGFNLNTLVYSAIMYKVRAMTLAPLRAWTGSYEQREPVDVDEPLAQLIARPNPHQSWKEFQGQAIVYLNISGNNFTLLDRKRQGELPEAMYNLRPDRVFVVPGTVDGQGIILGYIYVPEGKSAFLKWDDAQRRAAWSENRVFPILPEDMMHPKFPNPGDPLEGMGEGMPPMSPAARSIDVDNAVTHFLKLFFDKGVMVPGMITVEGSVDDGAIARAKERWKEIYGGYKNWAEEIFVSDRSAKYERVGLTFDEMGFEEIDERNESRILAPFGVPPILVGARVGLTRSSYGKAYEEARRAFWEDTMLAESGWFEDEYSYYLQDGNIFVAFDYSRVPALQKNIPQLVESAHMLWQMGVPANQATDKVGLALGGIPGGDVAYVPLGMIPSGMSVEPETTEEGAPEAEDDTRKMLLLPAAKKKELAV